MNWAGIGGLGDWLWGHPLIPVSSFAFAGCGSRQAQFLWEEAVGAI
jgi:hypothetical protein